MATPTKGGGQIKINTIRLYHNSVKNIKVAKSSDKFMDLMAVFSGLNIRESVIQPFMTAELMINDSNDMIADYPIVGGEIFHIIYNPTEEDDTKNDLWFRVVGIKGVLIDERKQGFTVQLISEAGFKNLTTTISSSFTGAPHDIVHNIWSTYLNTVEINKSIAVDRSVGGMKFVCPRWTPIKAIRYVMNKAIDYEGETAGFFFFETPHGFRFLSTATLLDEKRNLVITDVMGEAESIRPEGKIKKGYHYKIPGIPVVGSDGKPTSGMVGDETMQNVDEFRIDSRQMLGRDIVEGYLASKNIVHDIFHKSYTVNTYDYFEDFNNSKRLAKYPKYVEYEKEFDSNIKITLSPKHTNVQEGYRSLFADDYVQSRSNVVKQISDEVLSNFVVPGNPIICSGRLVEFNFPAIKKVEDPTQVYQKKYSGKYLVRDCLHIIKPVGNGTASYKCDMNIVKDGWNKV